MVIIFLFLSTILIPWPPLADAYKCTGPGAPPHEDGVVRAQPEGDQAALFQGGKPNPPDKKTMVPFKILFVPDSRMKDEKHKSQVKQLQERINKRLEDKIKSHPLTDLRMPLKDPAGGAKCPKPLCYDDLLPIQFLRNWSYSCGDATTPSITTTASKVATVTTLATTTPTKKAGRRRRQATGSTTSGSTTTKTSGSTTTPTGSTTTKPGGTASTATGGTTTTKPGGITSTATGGSPTTTTTIATKATSTSLPDSWTSEPKPNTDKYTLVVFVLIVHDGVRNEPDYCRKEKSSYATGFGHHCREDEFGRPTHGRLLFCGSIGDGDEELLDTKVLHEVLHIITGFSLVGLGNPVLGCGKSNLDEKQCKGITWNIIPRQWTTNPPTDKDTLVAITSSVQKAARDYFNCQTLEGAQLNNKDAGANKMKPEVLNQYGHWNYRLFSDEIMSPIFFVHARLSNLTLSALMDSQWYDVDLTKAEPMMIGRPQKFGCEVATMSCAAAWALITDPAEKKISVNTEPYCSFEQPMREQSYCSRDGRTMLSCQRSTRDADDCTILIATPNVSRSAHEDFYDSAVCEMAVKQPEDTKTHIGGQVGPKTMCVTITKLPNYLPNANKPKVHVLCAKRDCVDDKQNPIVKIVLAPKTDDNVLANCIFECRPEHTNKIVELPSPNDDCKKYLGDKISLVCPEFASVCKNVPWVRKTTPAPCPPGTTGPTGKPCPPTQAPCKNGTCPPAAPTTSPPKQKLESPVTPGANDQPKSETVIALLGFIINLALAKIVQKLF